MNKYLKGMPIDIMQKEVTANCKAKGWYDDDRTFGDMVALLHSEVSEVLEAYRDYHLGDVTGIPCEENDYTPKPEGVGSEMADVFIRLLDMAERYGVDLEAEFWRKHEFNKTRPYKHGGKAL